MFRSLAITRIASRYLNHTVQNTKRAGTCSPGAEPGMLVTDFARRWAHQAPPILFDRRGGVSIPDYASNPVSTEVRQDLARVAWSKSNPRFTTSLHLNSANADRFEVDPDDILNTKSFGTPIEKFSWNPVTGEILFVFPPMQHATVQGRSPFDDYVRAIILRDRKKVLFRPFWPTWMRQTPYDTFDEEAAMVSMDAQWHAKEMVESHGGAGWDIELNTSNKMLTEMTGRRNW